MARTSSPIRAPEFPAGLEWLNTDRPLTLKELRGKVVILDFWTYCCINCMHMGAQLRRLEEKWREELVVVGVHAAKFPSERLTANIMQAARRHRVRHPIVNDWNFKVWEQYTVRAWPTVAVIDAEGYISAQEQGEVRADILDHLVERAVERAEILRILKRSTPSPPAVVDDGSTLAYPGKLVACDGRLYVADSLHDRIVMCEAASGQVERVYGSGKAGFQDGPSGQARFQNPQGMALADGFLYVAEPDNHAIRRVHLESGNVRTVAGSGRQAAYFHTGGPALAVDLSSPWDLAWHDGTLFVAMAGFHQIWRLDVGAGRVEAFAGSGREGLRDGPRDEAWLAQPSSLVVHDDVLYFADAESSSVRCLRLDGGPVSTLVGRGMFEYGDVDGVGDGARLQHPMAVAAADGVLYVADSYNNRIKRLVLGTRAVSSWAGDNVNGMQDGDVGEARFYEPTGLAVEGGRLYVADTNNHAIRVVDLEAGEVTTLALPFIP